MIEKHLRSAPIYTAFLLIFIISLLVFSMAEATGVPTPPTGFAYSLNGAIVTLNWNSSGAGVFYRIYYGRQSGLYNYGYADVGQSTQAGPIDMSVLGEGTYYAALAASTDGINWSSYSNEISVPFTLTGTQITDLAYAFNGYNLLMNWSAIKGLNHYRIYFGTKPGMYDLGYINTGYAAQFGPADTSQVGNGTYYGAVKFSADGNTWSRFSNEAAIPVANPGLTLNGQYAGTLSDLHSVVFFNNLFVAVGGGGTITVSPDAFSWSVVPSGVGTNLNDVTGAALSAAGSSNGTNEYIAVGDSGTILSSTDGQTWIAAARPTAANLNAIVYGNGTFVAAGNGGTSVVSADGVTWTSGGNGGEAPAEKNAVSGDKASTSADLMGITYGNGLFVAVGKTGIILTSTDGINWTPSTFKAGSSLTGVAFGGGSFLAVGGNSTLVTSTNALSWSKVAANISDNLRKVLYNGTVFVAIGDTNNVYTSPDGVNWSLSRAAGGSQLNGIAYGNGYLAMVGNSGRVAVTNQSLVMPSTVFTVTPVSSNTAWGTINCSPLQVVYGGSSVCTIKPLSGYKLKNVIDNSQTLYVGSVSTYSYAVSSVTSNRTVLAVFTTASDNST